MPDVDIYGNILDAGTIEGWFTDTLKAWLPAHLAHQERRLQLPARTIPQPRSWPLVSEFDLEPHDQLPAIVIASPGTAGGPSHDRGIYRVTWRIEAAVAIADRTEREARTLAGIYIAAIRGAIVQNRTLDDKVENARWVGPDDHAIGVTSAGGQRAIYGTAFEIDVRDVVNARQGPAEPPADPYEVPGAPEYPNVSEFTVEAKQPQEAL